MSRISGSLRTPAVLLLPLLFLLAGCPATPPPSPGGVGGPPPTQPPTTTTAAPVAPSLLVNGVLQSNVDVCTAMMNAADGDVITIRGVRSRPIDLSAQPGSAPSGRCYFSAGAHNVTVKAEGDPLLLGQLTLSNADGWLLDGITMTPAPAGDREPLAIMVGGDGWRWTNCELYGSGAFAELNIGHWTGKVPTNFRLDHCYIHDNQGNPANADNQNDNIYVFTVNDTPANGIIEDNVFVGAHRGWNVKIGGTGLRDDEGSDGITFRNNILVNNHPAGANLLLSTDSDDVDVHHNVFVAQGTIKPVNVNLGSFSGSGVVLSDNVFWGYQPDLYPKPRPILYAYYGVYESIDLNESSVRIDQARNIRHDPGYPALRTFEPDPSRFPPVTVNGVTYGVNG